MFLYLNKQPKYNKGDDSEDSNKKQNDEGLFGGSSNQTQTTPILRIPNIKSIIPVENRSEEILESSEQTKLKGMNPAKPKSAGKFEAFQKQQTQGLFKKIEHKSLFGGEIPYGKTKPQQISSLFGGLKAKQQGDEQACQCDDELFGQKNLINSYKTIEATQRQKLLNMFAQTAQLFKEAKQNEQLEQNQPAKKTEIFSQQQSQQTGKLFGENQPQKQESNPLVAQTPQLQIGGSFVQQKQAPLQTSELLGVKNNFEGLLSNQEQPQQACGFFGQPNQSGTIINIFTTSFTQTSPFWVTQPQQQVAEWRSQPQHQGTTLGAQVQQQPITQGWGQLPFALQKTNQFEGTNLDVNMSTVVQSQQNVKNQHPPITPVKSKNPKIDYKHRVKCIAALQQYYNISKEQIRIHFLTTGSFPNSEGFTQQTSGGLWGKPQTQTTTSFGIPQSNYGSLFGTQKNTVSTSSLLEQRPAATSLFSATQRQPQKQVSSTFGSQQLNQTESLFGGQTLTSSSFRDQTIGSEIFRKQPQTQEGSLFRGQQKLCGSSFGGQQPQETSLFGGTYSAQQNFPLSVQPQQSWGSLFRANQPRQQQLSLFGATQSQASGPLLGIPSQNTEGLFGNTPQQNAGGSIFKGQQQQRASLFGEQQFQDHSQASGMYGNTRPSFAQQQQYQYGFAQASSPQFGNLSMQLSIPSTLVNESIMDPNYKKSVNDMLALVSSVLMQGGAISFAEADRIVKKRQMQLQRQYFQQQPFRGIPPVFNDPMNFNRFQIPDNYFQTRRLANQQAEKKKKEENDKRNFSIFQTVKPRQEVAIFHGLKEQPDYVQEIVRNKYASVGQLPQVNEYMLRPFLSRFSEMTVSDLREVQDVEVSGEYGSIKFLEPISLLYKKIDNCVDIKQDMIDINDPQWLNKKCRLTFFNFAQYSQKSEKDKQKIEDKMFKWIKSNQDDKMELVQFIQDDGTLVVNIN